MLDVVEFTKDDAVLASKLEVETGKNGKKVPRFDAMIAAVAINRGALSCLLLAGSTLMHSGI